MMKLSDLLKIMHTKIIVPIRKTLSYLSLVVYALIAIVMFLQMKNPAHNYDEMNKLILVTIVLMGIAEGMYAFADRFLKEVNIKYEYREYLLKELEREESKDEGSEDTTEEKTNNKEKEIIDDSADDKNEKRIKKDIIALMLKNNDEITEYFKISKRQAKSSYRFSIFSCIAGILMLGVAIYGITIGDNSQLAIAGTVSGAITEIISGTVLWVHNKSALQLNHYYNALHENEKFLSAINLADKLSDEKREEMYKEIIRKQIESKEDK